MKNDIIAIIDDGGFLKVDVRPFDVVPSNVTMIGTDTCGRNVLMCLNPTERDALIDALVIHREANYPAEDIPEDEDDEPDMLEGVTIDAVTIKHEGGDGSGDVSVDHVAGEAILLIQENGYVELTMEQAEKLIAVLTMLVSQ